MSLYNKHIILLKEQDTDNIDTNTDLYYQTFNAAHYEVRYTTPIKFEITSEHTTNLIHELRNIDLNVYSGIVITSPRVYTLLYTIAISQKKLFTDNVLNIPLYHLNTQTSLEWIQKLHFHNARTDSSIVDSNTLAQYIVRNKESHNIKPILFICGQQHLPTLPDILTANKIQLHKCVVYDTIQKSDFSWELDKSIDVIQHTHVDQNVNLLNARHTMSDTTMIFIVFFSPSGVNAYYGMTAADSKQTKFDSREHQNKLLLNNRHMNLKVIAIGQTTGNALLQHNINVDGIAQRPTPDALLAACEAFMPTVNDVLDAVQNVRRQ